MRHLREHKKIVAPQRNRVLQILEEMKPILKESYGVTQLGVFGSVARDQATADSDIDIVIEMERPNLFISVNIKEALEAALDAPVDLVRYRDRMNAYLKESI